MKGFRAPGFADAGPNVLSCALTSRDVFGVYWQLTLESGLEPGLVTMCFVDMSFCGWMGCDGKVVF